MQQQSSFSIPLNPTAILVVGLIVAMFVGNRWRDPTDDTRYDDSNSDSNSLGVNDSQQSPVAPVADQSATADSDRFSYPQLGDNKLPSEPQRLPYAHLVDDARPIRPGEDNTDGSWISPPIGPPPSLGPPQYGSATISPEPIRPALGETNRQSGPGGFVSLPVVPQNTPKVQLSAPRVNALEQRTSPDDEWGPIEAIDPGIAIPIGRLPRPSAPKSPASEAASGAAPVSNGADTSNDRQTNDRQTNDRQTEDDAAGEGESVNLPAADRDDAPLNLPPLIAPQTTYEDSSSEWTPVSQIDEPLESGDTSTNTLDEFANHARSEFSKIDWTELEEPTPVEPAPPINVPLTNTYGTQVTGPNLRQPTLESQRAAESQSAAAFAAAQAAAGPPLPSPLNPQAVRSSEVTARRHVEAAIQFATHRAFAAARAELETALRTLAAGADASSPTPTRVSAVTSALQALEEAEDFLPGSDAIQSGQSVRKVSERHRTPIARQLERELPATEAIELYYTFAQQAMLQAVGHSSVSSDAFYQLGKLYTEAANTNVITTRAHAARATLFHESSLRINRSQFLAANELGVLLAKAGQWRQAKTYLLHSLTVHPLPETWFNLSKVHTQLNEGPLAERADYEYRMLARANPERSQAAIQWVSPDRFAAASAPAQPPQLAGNTQGPMNAMQATGTSDRGNYGPGPAPYRGPSYGGPTHAEPRQAAKPTNGAPTRWAPWRRTR